MPGRHSHGRNSEEVRRRKVHPMTPWGSGAHEVVVKRGQMEQIPPDVRLAYEIGRVLPGLVGKARREQERAVHYDQTRLICIRCEWVPRQKNRLRILEGRGYVCVDYDACEKRQVMG